MCSEEFQKFPDEILARISFKKCEDEEDDSYVYEQDSASQL